MAANDATAGNESRAKTIELSTAHIGAATYAASEIQQWAQALRAKADEIGTDETPIMRGMARRISDLTEAIVWMLTPNFGSAEERDEQMRCVIFADDLLPKAGG